MLSNYEPTDVLSVFEEYCSIPHGSGNVSAAADFCVRYATDRGFEAVKDVHDNVIIRVPGTPYRENHPPVIVQGHLDMVCEKDSTTDFDFGKDGLRLDVKDGWLYAKGTTLGGDDGIAVAMGLALLTSEAPHPPLEIVFTSDEETGMLGAEAMDMSELKGRRMLNLDSESEGVLTVACAGGERINLNLPITRTPYSGVGLNICLSGLRGGHSGEEINSGRENADILLSGLLYSLQTSFSFRLCEISGGSKDNAIPREANAVIVCDELPLFKKAAEEYFGKLVACYPEEEDMKLEFSPCAPDSVLDADSTKRILQLLFDNPNGVQAMREADPNAVQTSLNLGILETGRDSLSAGYLVRSCVNGERDEVSEVLRRNCIRLGGTCTASGRYPAWEYVEDSALRDLMVKVWKEQTGKDAEVISIHAGLECGLFSGKLPGLDCVSFGPDMQDIHTPKERLNLESVARCYTFLIRTLDLL